MILHSEEVPKINVNQATSLATPSGHRTRLGPTPHQPSRVNPGDYRAANGLAQNSASKPTASTRRPFANLDVNRVNGVDRSGMSGFGMSAGMKAGRQPGESLYNRLCLEQKADGLIMVMVMENQQIVLGARISIVIGRRAYRTLCHWSVRLCRSVFENRLMICFRYFTTFYLLH